jgi:hypothetical protein
MQVQLALEVIHVLKMVQTPEVRITPERVSDGPDGTPRCRTCAKPGMALIPHPGSG